jgi:hypothetical protein
VNGTFSARQCGSRRNSLTKCFIFNQPIPTIQKTVHHTPLAWIRKIPPGESPWGRHSAFRIKNPPYNGRECQGRDLLSGVVPVRGKIPRSRKLLFGDNVANKGLCVLCAVNQNYSSNASATASSTVNLCPSVESLAKSDSFNLERMTSRSRSTETCSTGGRESPIFSRIASAQAKSRAAENRD